jgi:hypothetical protein
MASAKAEIGDGGVGRGRRDTVVQRVASGGRLVSFIAVDLIPGRPLRLWGALVETGDSAGGGAHGIEGTGGTEPSGGAFIRLGLLGVNDGWSVTQLLAVAQARFVVEFARVGAPEVEAIIRCLERAAAVHREALDDEPVLPVAFEAVPCGAESASVPWTVARAGLFTIALCPDAEGRGEGITPGQLLVLIDLALSAWLPVTPWRRRAWEARRAVREALAIEANRVAA